ncbi:MAG: hypothetical protein ACE5D3_08380 [Candidatus Binatia bacterium]
MPRNSHNAESNPSLRTRCSSCGESIPTQVSSDYSERKTWGLVGTKDGEKRVFATCTKCYDEGWRPPGYSGF